MLRTFVKIQLLESSYLMPIDVIIALPNLLKHRDSVSKICINLTVMVGIALLETSPVWPLIYTTIDIIKRPGSVLPRESCHIYIKHMLLDLCVISQSTNM